MRPRRRAIEEVAYDANDQPLTASFMDYAIPRASDFPRFELDNTVTPTPVNPLGAKGVGEAGTISSTPCIVAAAVDALSGFGVRHLDMMLRPASFTATGRPRARRHAPDCFPSTNERPARRRACEAVRGWRTLADSAPFAFESARMAPRLHYYSWRVGEKGTTDERRHRAAE